MSSFKPPRTPRSPFLKKENVDNTKRRRVGVTANMVGPTISRSRSILSTINSGLNGASQSDNLSDVASNIGIEFTCKEEVQALLAERLKFKKNDFKGRCEQQSEYIRKLRGCINWQMEQIDAQLTEKETLLSSLESEHTRHSQQECEMKKKIEELGTTIEELTRDLESLQEAFNQETAAKRAALEAYQTEKELKISAENSVETLEIELEKTREESERLSNELMVVRDNSKRLTEYNNSLQQYNSNLQAERAKEHEKNQILEKEKSIIRDEMASLKDQNRSLLAQINSSKSSQQEALSQRDTMSREVECLRSELNAVRDERDNTHSKFQNLNNELESFKAMFGKSSKDLDNLVAKTTALEETCESQREQIVMLKSQLMTANEKFKLADRSAGVAISEYEEAKNKIESLQERLSNAELRLLEGEKLRKKLHNTIQELKGNIRVFCRVRPVINNGTESDKSVVSFPTSTEAAGRGIDLINQGQMYNFMFDKVFGSESSQQDVFVEISQLVQSALDGYKVCIFAYGQTGSGKTFTMMGKNQSLDQKGLIPRSLEQIFETSHELKNQGWRYRIQASMLEIYNETIRDLLKPGQPDASDSKCYNVATHDKDGNAMVDVHSIKEVSFLLKQAAKSRSVGRTQMNEESSRSHFVFTLCISGTNESTGQQVQGALNLIDLAGSERLAKSGSTGDRLKETQAINRSLSALGDVIFAIAKKEKHIPYRNSKLTMHLEPYLGGDSKTLMFVNVSPEASSCGESLCSLRFAARVNSCEIGIPRRQTQVVVPQIRC